MARVAASATLAASPRSQASRSQLNDTRPMVRELTPRPVINTGPTPLCLYTVYAPAEHAETTVHKTKEEGDKLEDEGKDEAPKWAKN